MSRRYLRARSLEEALNQLCVPGASIISGGTDLMVKIHSGTVNPDLIIDISELHELSGISDLGNRIEIGAAVTQTDILRSEAVREKLPLLALVLQKLGSVQTRNRGTLGGNLVNASPAADGAIPLLLLDASLIISAGDSERELPIADFFLGPGQTALRKGELLRAISIPIPEGKPVSFFHKIGRRRALTIAIASLGGLYRLDGETAAKIRLAAGSVAPTPLRLTAVEEIVKGKRLTPELIEEAKRITAGSVSPIDDIRASAEYRRDVVCDLVADLLAGLSDA